ncbi:hypothetical protein BGZ81_002757 [Podila clonocystis]|nr:hypothetical protein BGZ81_002757 [Podila clonocystis]
MSEVVPEEPPLAQYLQDIHRLLQEQIAAQTITKQDAPATMMGSAVGMVESFFEYISHTFTPAATDADDAQFEERFKYFICTSPFLNKNATLQTVRDQRIYLDTPVTSEISSAITPARFGLTVGAGSFALLFMRMVIARVNVKGWTWLQPVLNRIVNGVFALQKRRSQTLYNQALQSLQHLVYQCQTLDVKVNRAITAIQDLETLSRIQRLSTNMTPTSRLELASRMRQCNIIRAQLAASLLKTGSLFQQSTETLQSHIDHKRLSTLLDMYNISPSSRSNSPVELETERRASLYLSLPNPDDLNRTDEPLTASPDTLPPTNATLYPNNQGHLPRPTLNRRSRTLNTGSYRNKRNSFQGSNMTITTGNLDRPPSRRRPVRRHTSWSASEGEDSDSGSVMSPRSSVYTHTTPSSTSSLVELTILTTLRKDFQRMHGFRREFLCELLSIRKKSQRGHSGVNALKDYDRNWIVVRNVLQRSVNNIASIVSELNKAMEVDPHNLPKMDTIGLGSFVYDSRFQPFAQRLSSLEQRVKDVQTKLFICQDDIKDSSQPDQPDTEKQLMLESQFNSISQDIAVLAAEWQQGQLALGSALKPHATDLASPISTSAPTAVGTPEMPGKSRSSIEDRLSKISSAAESVDAADESGDSGLGLDTGRRYISDMASPSSPSSITSFSANRERLHRRNLQVRHSVEMIRKSNEIWRENDQQLLLHQQQQPQRHLQLQMNDSHEYIPPYQPRSSSLAHRRAASNRNSVVFEGEVVSSPIESTTSFFRGHSESISLLSPKSPREFSKSLE